jgi:hypothetical protein
MSETDAVNGPLPFEEPFSSDGVEREHLPRRPRTSA